MAQVLASVTNTPHCLPFHQLSPEDFERLCLWLVEREGYENVEHPGAAGADHGCDIVAWRQGEQYYFQCKRVQRFQPRHALVEVKKVMGLPKNERPSNLVFMVTCNVSRETRRRARAHCAGHMECELWSATKLDELVRRHPDIVTAFFTTMPTPVQPAHLFICYERTANSDRKLAAYLRECLSAEGHQVIVDTDLYDGEDWLRQIDQHIEASSLLIALLSEESADSEMIQAELRRAYQHRKTCGHPDILPVRIAYAGLLPYSIEAFLDSTQYIVWHTTADNHRVAHEILAALGGRLPKREPIQLTSLPDQLVLSEDGRILTDDQPLSPPLPEFDPRFLDNLEAPGGALKLGDALYIQRQADARLNRQLLRIGTTTTIRAPRQTGKTSLLVRGLDHARRNGARIVHLSLQTIDSDQLHTLDLFLRHIAEFVAHRLSLSVPEMDQRWNAHLSPQHKLTFFMEDHVLPKSNGAPLLLAIDEADRLLQTPVCTDFFALLRSWHEDRPLNERWNRISIVTVISTEPYLLIDDVTQSPFNVGLTLSLQDFDESQVQDLISRHGYSMKPADFPQFMQLFNGHPYLTRKALYVLAVERCTCTDLFHVATQDYGPFGDHLRRYHFLLRDEPKLRDSLTQVINHSRCADDVRFFRLLRAGLVKGTIDSCTCRCGLYRRYFEGKL